MFSRKARFCSTPVFSYKNTHIYQTFKEKIMNSMTARILTMTITIKLPLGRHCHWNRTDPGHITLGLQSLQDLTLYRHSLEWFKSTLPCGPQSIPLRTHHSRNLTQAVSISRPYLKLNACWPTSRG